MPRLGPNRYGKAEVRVVRVVRGGAPDGGDVLINLATKMVRALHASAV